MENNEAKRQKMVAAIKTIDKRIAELPFGMERELQVRNRDFCLQELFKVATMTEIMKWGLLDLPM